MPLVLSRSDHQWWSVFFDWQQNVGVAGLEHLSLAYAEYAQTRNPLLKVVGEVMDLTFLKRWMGGVPKSNFPETN